jgi:hypothetical protein
MNPHLAPVRPDGGSLSLSLCRGTGSLEGRGLEVLFVRVAGGHHEVDGPLRLLENSDGLLVADLRVQRLAVDGENLKECLG